MKLANQSDSGSASKTEKLEIGKKRWAAYAAAGIASAMVGAQTAEADISHVIVGSANGGDIETFDDKYFDLVGGAKINLFNISTSSTSSNYQALVAIFDNGDYFGAIAGTFNGSFPYASNLAVGANISTQNFIENQFATLAYGYGYGGDQFLDRGGIFGFRFDAGNGIQFGWARLSLLSDSPLNEYTLEEYAFADVGESIRAGQTSAIPEPTSLGLLALGAIGLLANRRRNIQPSLN